MSATRPGMAQRLRHSIARWLSPLAPSRRTVRRFEAARIDRITSNWMATSASINEELRTDLDKLRMRGRDLVKNNDYAKKFTGMCQNNIVGPDGFRLQVRIQDQPGRPDKLANQAIERAFADWARAADITGTMSLNDVCDTLIGGLPSDGEFLVRFVRGPEAGNRFNFAIQLIDVDRIDTSYNTTATGTGNKIVMGVERDTYGRPLALWLFDGHPNDGPNTSRSRSRVSVDEVLHRFRVETPGQARGIPWMAPGMLSLHHLGGFKLAALLAAEHGANHYGFFMTPDGAAPIGAEDASGQQISTSQPGTFDTLPTGVEFKPFESKYPEANFGPFVKVTLQRIASGWRVAYHSLANDLEGVSFSSIRSGTLEERDRWAADQAWFINAFMEPMYAAWLQMALLSGAITMPNGSALPASKIEKFRVHEWQGRRWEWVDPQSDMNAKILGVRAGLLAPQDLAAQMGYDFDDTLAKIKAAQDMAAGYGIALTAYEATPGAQQAGQQAADLAKAQADQATAAAKHLDLSNQRSADATRAHTETMAALIGGLTRREIPAPVVNNTYHLPELRNEITVQPAAPAAVEIRNEINVPEPVVNFEAVMPAQRSDAPVVNVQVQPAEVIVNNTHPARAVQVVERDAQDEITRTVTTYEMKE